MWLIKLIPYIIPFIMGSLVGFYINLIKIDTLKKDLKIKIAECETARAANEGNIKTIKALQDELTKQQKIYNQRLKNCKQTVTKIEYLESLRDCKESKNENVFNSDDPVLIELNGMWNIKTNN